MLRMRAARAAGLMLAAAGAAGCAGNPAKEATAPYDPFERVNRGTYQFNHAIDKAVLRPVAKGYVNVTPQPVRTGISNFIANLAMPGTLINDVLQGKLRAAVSDVGRFVLNTTMGVGGLFDVASKAGIDHNDEDFGQTLGRWGTPPGPYIVLPFLGASDLRDGPSRVVDLFTNPAHYANTATSLSYGAVYVVDARADLLSLDKTLDSAFDPYAFLRNAYLKRRAYLISDGNVPDEELTDPDADADKPAPAPAGHPSGGATR